MLEILIVIAFVLTLFVASDEWNKKHFVVATMYWLGAATLLYATLVGVTPLA